MLKFKCSHFIQFFTLLINIFLSENIIQCWTFVDQQLEKENYWNVPYKTYVFPTEKILDVELELEWENCQKTYWHQFNIIYDIIVSQFIYEWN